MSPPKMANSENSTKPGVAISLAEMIEVAGGEAHRIEGSQRALVAAGDRFEPHRGQMRKAAAFWEIERLLKIWQANEAELRKAIRRLP